MHVAVDLDDVVLSFCGGLRTAIKTEYGIELAEFDKWELKDVLDPVIGYSWWKWMRERDWLWAQFPAIDGAIGGIQRLRSSGHYVECVTSKPHWAEFAVWRWLGKWRPPFQRVTIVGPDEPKSKATDADILIDDRPENVVEFVGSDPTRFALLYTQSHNKKFHASHGRVWRTNGWLYIPAAIEAIELEESNLV